MKVVFHKTAILELQSATSWLEVCQPGLGAKFERAAGQVLASIESNPLQFSPVPGSRHQDQFRVGLIRRFKYSIYFVVRSASSQVYIFAVQHGRQDPAQWRDRLNNFDIQE
jgi:plasmid stabilization system protein ParE